MDTLIPHYVFQPTRRFLRLSRRSEPMIFLRVAALIALLCPLVAAATEIEPVLAHPPFASFYSCTEHGAGQLPHIGDNLGTDCIVQRLVETDGRTWLRAYAGDGSRNEDWYGWNQEVLSPCECLVVKVQENREVNMPGVLGRPPAAYVVLKREDGVHFMIGHVQSIAVREKDRLRYGQPFARVGNNGYSRHPHIHIGAWKDETALQIRFDQTQMKVPAEYQAPGAQQAVQGGGPL